MVSPTSTTDKYAIQPSLLAKHRKTLEWLSAATLWKRELTFFQKLLDEYSPKLKTIESKQRIDHFQNIITYYKGELIDSFMTRLRQHEKELAHMLETKDESRIEYFKEHDALMTELESLGNQFAEYKEDLFGFVETVM